MASQISLTALHWAAEKEGLGRCNARELRERAIALKLNRPPRDPTQLRHALERLCNTHLEQAEGPAHAGTPTMSISTGEHSLPEPSTSNSSQEGPVGAWGARRPRSAAHTERSPAATPAAQGDVQVAQLQATIARLEAERAALQDRCADLSRLTERLLRVGRAGAASGQQGQGSVSTALPAATAPATGAQREGGTLPAAMPGPGAAESSAREAGAPEGAHRGEGSGRSGGEGAGSGRRDGGERGLGIRGRGTGREGQQRQGVEASVPVVFFGLPLSADTSNRAAGLAVQQFCAEKLHLAGVPLPHVERVGSSSPQLAGTQGSRPATAVAVRIPSSLWHQIRQAKRQLPRDCLVSIDMQRSREECVRLRAMRQHRRQAGEAGVGSGEGEGQRGEGEAVAGPSGHHQ